MTDVGRPDDWRHRFRVAVAAGIGRLVVRVLGATWRVSRGARSATSTPVVYSLWHGELLPLLWAHRGEGIVVLISTHADGEIIARIAASLGYGLARGSSSRGATRALVELSRAVESGRNVAVTPDGPRGPRHAFAPGVLVVAQRTGVPVVCARASASRAWRLRSWDRFVIPKPFARVTVRYGLPEIVAGTSARDAEAEAPRFARLMGELGRPNEDR
jgi:lysophospholipid acyltransferase (LPLAT)-like uncharacterized protein